MSLPSDTYRKAQLLGGMCVNDHPMGKFMWGKYSPCWSLQAQNKKKNP